MTVLSWARRMPVLLIVFLATESPAEAQQAEVVELLAVVWDDGVEAALHRYDAFPSDPRNPSLLVQLADQLLWTGKDAEAIDVLARAEAEAPELAEIRFQQGRAHLHRGRGEAALHAFGQGLARVDADPTLSDADRASLANRFRNRIGLLGRSAELVPRSGAFRTTDGRLLSFKFDPYLHTFPAVVDLSTGHTRILFPSATHDLEWRNADGSPAGTVGFERGPSDLATLVLRQGEEPDQRADALPIALETVRFTAAGASIEGTLLLPASDAPVPAVVLLHGAGLSTRYNLMHEAVAFAAAGVAAFVYDKPGLGASTGGNWLLLSIAEQAAYATAAADLLRARPGISEVGVWGVSQGGWVAPYAAREVGKLDFVVLVAGAAVSPQEQSIQASVRRLRENGFSDEDVDAAVRFQREMWSRINAGADGSGLEDLRAMAGGSRWGTHVRQPRLGFELGWWRDNEVDVPRVLESLAVPVLSVFAERDDAVPPDDNVPPMAGYLATAPTGDYTIAVLPDANHQMMVGNDYHPLYFVTFTAWVAARFGGSEP